MNPHHFSVGYVPPAGAFPPGPGSLGFAFPQSPRQSHYVPAPIYSVAPSMPWPGVSAVPYAPPMVYTYSPTWGATAYQPPPIRPRFPFAGRDVAGNEGRPLQFPAVNSAGNPSSVRRGNNSARDTVSSTGNTASLDREPFPIVSGPLNSNPVVELPPSEPANDVLNDPRVAEALEARGEVGVHEPERAPEPDRPNECDIHLDPADVLQLHIYVYTSNSASP
ncbi:hypothetical protein QAD02_005732 [Eretmocerus hayati]|uniref:Uncharacterized protein n=1 Tax=Eretmocerus hayati TaxID=131215 RepID=A0ACC2NT89_9HYME|nr:hypothetical protein QAD02_005732 [Eretmocerus hayati]